MRSLKTITVAVTSLVLLTLPPRSLAQTKPAWFGTWNLNFAKSSSTDSPAYKRVTSRIEPWGDGLRVTYDMVGIRGGVTHWEWTGRLDGKDYPVQGADTFLTNAYRKIDDKSYEITIKIDGSVAAGSRVTVSADGNALNVVTGKTTSVYERAHAGGVRGE